MTSVDRRRAPRDVTPGLTLSARLLERSCRVVPGGVHTARRKLDPPICFRSGSGAYLEDLDGRVYTDYHAAYGPVLLGHGFEPVTERVIATIRDQVLFGVGTTELEVQLAEKVVQHVPSIQQVLFCGSGSEATYHAIRLARAVTDRPLILKCQGHYHGFHDAVLRNALSTAAMIGERDPHSAGMLDSTVDATLVCDFNDLESVRGAFDAHQGQIAAVIVEPIAHNSPSIMPAAGFLEGLRALCDASGSLLIFDEVITGFRHALGGYQSICGVTPDLTTLGKAMANGFPIAAVGGSAEHLARFNTTPDGDVTFAGTFNGGAVGVAAALATIEVLERQPVHEHVFALGARMRDGLAAAAEDVGIPVVVSGYGSLYTLLFMEGPLLRYEDALRNDGELLLAYRRALIQRGVFEMPESLGRNHISFSHTSEDVDRTIEVAHAALEQVAR